MDTSACWWWRQMGLKAGEASLGPPATTHPKPRCASAWKEVVVRPAGASYGSAVVLRGTDRAGGPAPGPILSCPAREFILRNQESEETLNLAGQQAW